MELAHRAQQLAAPVRLLLKKYAAAAALAFAKNGSTAGDTPIPGYARTPVPGHNAADDGDDVGETVAVADNDAETEGEAPTDADTDGDAALLGVIDEVGVSDAEKEGGAVGARKTDEFDATKGDMGAEAAKKAALML